MQALQTSLFGDSDLLRERFVRDGDGQEGKEARKKWRREGKVC